MIKLHFSPLSTTTPTLPTSEIKEKSELASKIKSVRNTSITMTDALHAMSIMDKERAQGSFKLDDGRRYVIRDGEVLRQNIGSTLTRAKEGMTKMFNGRNASSSDASRLTAALQSNIAPNHGTIFSSSWDSSRFTNPKDISQTMGGRGHESKQPFQFIVHTAPISHLIEGKGIFSARPEEALASFDVASTSLVNQDKTYTYGSVGVILKVPGQNILAASPDDLMSETNIGLVDRTERLVNVTDKESYKSLYQSMHDYQRNGLLKTEIARYHRHTNTPEEVLNKTYGMRNEVIICTSEGVNIHQGAEATDKVEIVGFFLNDSALDKDHQSIADWKGKKLLSQDEKCSLFQQYAKPLSQKLEVPMIYLNGTVDFAETVPNTKVLSN